MIVVDELIQTCEASPSQWQGKTRDGRVIYVRYRWGWLQVGIGQTTKQAVEDFTVRMKVGGEYDGYMDFVTLATLTRGRVSWPCIEAA